jgi:hypothetical protein
MEELNNHEIEIKSGGKPGVPGGAAPLGWEPAFPTLRSNKLPVTSEVESLSNN